MIASMTCRGKENEYGEDLRIHHSLEAIQNSNHHSSVVIALKDKNPHVN